MANFATFFDNFSGDKMQLWFLAGIVVVMFIMLRKAATHRSRTKRNSSATKQHASATRPSFEAHKMAGNLEIRLHDTFREMNGRTDTKIHVLNELLIEAEAKIAELKRLRGEPAGTSRPQTPPLSEMRGESADPTNDPSSLEREHEEPLVIDLESRLAHNSTDITQIYKLADEGFSTAQISESIGKQIREVELILGLRRRREQA